jgi:type IX secretion system PorP/SprF family membrane protein
MKKIILIFVFICSIQWVKGQEVPRYTNYLFNPYIINPGAAGNYDYLNAMVAYRNQWAGIEGAPTTVFGSIDGSAFNRKVGYGMQFLNDQVAAFQKTLLSPTLTYRLGFSEKRWFALGFSGILEISQLRASMIQANSNGDDVLNGLNLGGNNNNTRGNVTVGGYYSSSTLVAGLSFNNILTKENFYTFQGKALQGANLNRNYFQLFGGYTLTLNNDFAFQPSMLVKSDEKLSQLQVDLSGLVYFKNRIALGASYRHKESINGLIDVWLTNDLRLGYAYDFSTTDIRNYTTGSHEIMLAYRFGRYGALLNPRNFYNTIR